MTSAAHSASSNEQRFDQERARFLRLGLLVLTPLIAILGMVIFPLLANEQHPADTAVFWSALVGTMLLLLAYLLVAKGLVRTSAATAIMTMNLGPYIAAYSIPSLFMFSSVGTVLATTFFTPAVIAAIGLACALMAISLPLLSEGASYSVMIPLAGFHLMLPVLLVLVTWQKERWDRIANETLEAKNLSLRNEIEQRQVIEDELRDHLEQRAALLRELNHRVRNNLGSVIGIISMENMRGRCQCCPSPLTRIEQRIRTISNINTLLDEANWEELELSAIVQLAHRTLSAGPKVHLELRTSPEAITLDTTTATALGQVLAELVSNSLTHGANEDGAVTITIDARMEDGELDLSILDDGPGYAPEILDAPEQREYLGLRLASALTKSLPGASMRLSSEGGARAWLRVPMSV